jgi:hypothetical protein
MPDWAADYEGDGQEQAARDGRDSEQWWRLWRQKMAAVDNNGSGWQQRRTTTAVDDDGTQDPAADYEGEGGERAANNNDIREKADKPAGQRAWKNKEIKFTQKDFFQQYGLSGWIFCSHKNSQCALLILSVLSRLLRCIIGIVFKIRKRWCYSKRLWL